VVLLGLLLVAGAPSGRTLAQASGAAGEPFVYGPPPGHRPVEVHVDFELRDVADVDDEAETFTFIGVLTVRWHDPRQAFDPAVAGVSEKVYQGDHQVKQLFRGWYPQLVLANEAAFAEPRGLLIRIRSDGSMTLIGSLAASADADLSLRRYPFDTQTLEARFEVLGARGDDVALVTDPSAMKMPEGSIHAPQWVLQSVEAEIRQPTAPGPEGRAASPAFVLRMHVARDPFFMMRLVMLPLGLIVVLSWSVFWVDRSFLGDRLNISFVCILTAVAYQMVISDYMPQISYMTLMNGFVNLSFIVMGFTVLSNLRCGRAELRGDAEEAERIDRKSRWVFPAAYFGLLALMVGVAFTLF